MRARGNITVEYDPADVGAITPDHGPMSGGYDVEIFGKSFGVNKTDDLTAYIGKNACIFTRWVSDNKVVCTAPAGTGMQKSIYVMAGGKRGPHLGHFNYDAPVVSKVMPEVGLAKGGSNMTIIGSGFGAALRNALVNQRATNGTNGTARFAQVDVNVTVLVGGKKCGRVQVVSDTEIKCIAPEGVGKRRVVVSVNGHQSYNKPPAATVEAFNAVVSVTGGTGPSATGASGTGATGASGATGVHIGATASEATGAGNDENDSIFDSEAPSVTSMKPNWSHGEGGKKLNIKGANFGPKGNDLVVVKIDGETATNVMVKSDSELTCIAPAGSGVNVSVKVYVEGKTGKSYDRFEYDPPLVLNSFPAKGTADTKVMINGLNFGAMDEKVQAFIGRVPCKMVRRVGPDSVECTAPAGIGKNLSVTVKTHGRHHHTRVNKSATFTYPPAAVTSVKPRSVPTEGGWIMISGNGFGAKDGKFLTGMIDQRPCVKTVWISSKKVRCFVPAGVGKNVSVSVYVGDGELAAPKNILSYRHPVVHKIEPNHAPGSGSNMSVVTLTVSEIGEIRAQHQKKISLGADSIAVLKKIERNVTIGGKPCKIVNVTATTIKCVVPKGIGYDLPVIVTVQNVSSPANPKALFEYDGPAIASVTPSVVPCLGGKRIVIDGTSFGTNVAAEDMAVLVGGKECANVSWVNDTAVSCVTPPGLGSQRGVVVVMKGIPSRPFKAFSYARPNVRSASPRISAPGATNLKLMIRGSNFGPHMSLLDVFIGKQKCGNVHFFNDSALSCVLPKVRVGKFNVRVVVGGQANKKNKLFESSPPEIDSINPQSGPSRGGYPLTIKGVNFIKDAHAEHEVSVSGLKCGNVRVTSNTELTCNAPKGIAGIQNITVIVNGNPSEPSQDFAYNSPSVRGAVPSHGNKVGGQRIIIKGSDFGSRRPKQGSLVATIGGKACQKTKWISDSEVECVVPEGEGACKAIQVRVGKKESQISHVNTMWHYDNPADAEKSFVQDLDENNFDKIVNGDSPVLIKFCTPKCEHCRALKPIYKELARLLKCKKVVIAAVRADTHPALAKRFGLNDYPRLLWFPEGRTLPQGEFQGNAKAEYLLGWLAKQMGVPNQLYGTGKEPVEATQPLDEVEKPLAGGLIGAVQSGDRKSVV